MGEGEGEGQLLGEREHCREDVLQDCNSYIKVRGGRWRGCRWRGCRWRGGSLLLSGLPGEEQPTEELQGVRQGVSGECKEKDECGNCGCLQIQTKTNIAQVYLYIGAFYYHMKILM